MHSHNGIVKYLPETRNIASNSAAIDIACGVSTEAGERTSGSGRFDAGLA